MSVYRVIIAVIALALVSGTGGAAAAVPPGGTVGPANESVFCQGQPYAASATSEPRFCAPQAADPINLVCDHVTLHVEAPGTVTAPATLDVNLQPLLEVCVGL